MSISKSKCFQVYCGHIWRPCQAPDSQYLASEGDDAMVSIRQVTTDTHVFFLVQGRKRGTGTGTEHRKTYEWNHPALGVHRLVWEVGSEGETIFQPETCFFSG